MSNVIIVVLKLLSFLHLYLLFYGRGYRNVSAILLLDGVMIIISYTSPTISISLSISMWSQFATQASTCCIARNQEHISYRSPVIANFLLKYSKFRYHGNRGWSETNFAYTVNFADPENPVISARIRNISPIEAQLWPIFCYNFQIFVAMATRVALG